MEKIREIPPSVEHRESEPHLRSELLKKLLGYLDSGENRFFSGWGAGYADAAGVSAELLGAEELERLCTALQEEAPPNQTKLYAANIEAIIRFAKLKAKAEKTPEGEWTAEYDAERKRVLQEQYHANIDSLDIRNEWENQRALTDQIEEGRQAYIAAIKKYNPEVDESLTTTVLRDMWRDCVGVMDSFDKVEPLFQEILQQTKGLIEQYARDIDVPEDMINSLQIDFVADFEQNISGKTDYLKKNNTIRITVGKRLVKNTEIQAPGFSRAAFVKWALHEGPFCHGLDSMATEAFIQSGRLAPEERLGSLLGPKVVLSEGIPQVLTEQALQEFDFGAIGVFQEDLRASELDERLRLRMLYDIYRTAFFDDPSEQELRKSWKGFYDTRIGGFFDEIKAYMQKDATGLVSYLASYYIGFLAAQKHGGDLKKIRTQMFANS